jgi:hypothetical protein
MSEKTESFLRNLSMDFETATVAVNEMTDVQEVVNGGVTVYSGFHPEHGAIHIVIPALSQGMCGMMLLPFAFHSSER